MKVRNLTRDELEINSYNPNRFQMQEKIRFALRTDFEKYLRSGGENSDYYIEGENSSYGLTCENITTTLPIFDMVEKDNYTKGIRPVIEYKDEELDVDSLRKNIIDGVELVYFGSFPQRRIPKRNVKQMELEFKKNSTYYKKTNKYISTRNNFCMPNQGDEPLKFFKHQVIEWYDNKYIRCIRNPNVPIFSNKSFPNCRINWFRFSPIEWILDRENHLLISTHILSVGIPYETKNHAVNNAESYTLDNYLNNVFLNEIQGKPAVYNDLKNEVKKDETNKGIKKVCPTNFDLTDVSEEDIIKASIISDVPVFIHGASGDGKSERVEALDPNLEVLYMRNATPESLIGKSVVFEGSEKLIDIPPTWYLRLKEKCEREPDKIHILFFDELTNALPSIQSMAFNIILDKEINGKWKLPKNVRIVAAGNEVSDSLTSFGLAEPLFNRFSHVYINTTKELWIKWALEKEIHPKIIAYIASVGDKALRTKYTGKIPNADPRKWEMASRILYKTKNPELLRELIGDSLTTEFISFCLRPVISLENVLNNDYDENLVKSMSIALKYATLTNLLNATCEQFDAVYEFVKLMNPELTKIFEVLWCKNDPNKLEYLLIRKQEKILIKKVGH